MNKTTRKVHTIKGKIDRLYTELQGVQLACAHPDAVKIAKSIEDEYGCCTGKYWYNCTCPTCEKTWTEEQ